MNHRIQDLVVVAALAVAGGWSAASGFYAYGFPETSTSGKNWNEAAKESSEFIFFPPLFGTSLNAYFLTCISITVLAFGAVLWKKRYDSEKTRKKK